MKPHRIILIRHGQSVGNVDKSIYKIAPDYAIPLTDLGREQVGKAAKEIRDIIFPNVLDRNPQSPWFYGSPFWRTRQTFEILRKEMLAPKYYEDPRLREQEWGHLRDQSLTEKLEEYRDNYGHFYYRFNDGESCADVYDRVSDFLGTLNRDFEKPNFPNNVIIVTHGMTLRLFLMRFFHKSVEEFESWKNPKNAQYFILERPLKSDGDWGVENSKFELKTPLVTHKLSHSYQYKWGQV